MPSDAAFHQGWHERFSVHSFREAVERGDVDDWVRAFLSTERVEDAEVARTVLSRNMSWYGPVRVEFDRILCPEGAVVEPRLADLDHLGHSLDEEGDPPPIIASWCRDHLQVVDGQRRIDSMKRGGQQEWWTMVGFDANEDRGAFFSHLADRVVVS